MNKTTNLELVKAGRPFTWGRVLSVHDLGLNCVPLLEFK